jgi:hypothetical protein
MSTMSRRRFIIAGGAGAAVVVAGGAALAIRQFAQLGKSASSGTLSFQAVAGLPRPPLASYASYVIAGQVNLGANSGAITKTVFAGPPAARQPIALLTRTVRVTNVETQGSTRHITGTIADPSQLQQGEPTSFTIVIDPAGKTARSDFFGDAIQLNLEQFTDASQ